MAIYDWSWWILKRSTLLSKRAFLNFEVEIINLKNENEETESLVSESGCEILEQAQKVETLQEMKINVLL